VLVVDARHKHLPVVIANATARRYLTGEPGTPDFLETRWRSFLGASSAANIGTLLASVPDPRTTQQLASWFWRFIQGEQSAMTDIKPLGVGGGSAPGDADVPAADADA